MDSNSWLVIWTEKACKVCWKKWRRISRDKWLKAMRRRKVGSSFSFFTFRFWINPLLLLPLFLWRKKAIWNVTQTEAYEKKNTDSEWRTRKRLANMYKIHPNLWLCSRWGKVSKESTFWLKFHLRKKTWGKISIKTSQSNSEYISSHWTPAF